MSHDPEISAIDADIASLGAHDVARVGFGGMQLARLINRPADALALLARAIDLGVDHVDTAQFYGNGFANNVIRRVWSTGEGSWS